MFSLTECDGFRGGASGEDDRRDTGAVIPIERCGAAQAVFQCLGAGKGTFAVNKAPKANIAVLIIKLKGAVPQPAVGAAEKFRHLCHHFLVVAVSGDGAHSIDANIILVDVNDISESLNLTTDPDVEAEDTKIFVKIKTLFVLGQDLLHSSGDRVGIVVFLHNKTLLFYFDFS